MPIYNIKSMKWGDPDQRSVIMICDTHEGNDMNTATAYGPESGLWDDIKNYPTNQIQPYEPPAPEPAP